LPPEGRENHIVLTRLEYDQHPKPPQRDLRQRSVFDSEGHLIGQVKDIYVDEDRNFQFVGVAVRGPLGLWKNYHLVPVETIAEEESNSITLTVDQRTIKSAPMLDDPHSAPDEALQRAAREHCLG
jgi:sporulation protein YlmC with PRC-barrel domain